MKINEIFYSIQGEGKWTGRPNIFIRTTGCNLRCTYCDTKYAYENGKELKVNEVLKKIEKYNCNYVCITGGEPLLQDDIFDLIKKLYSKNYLVLIETNGSIDIKKLIEFERLIISLDIKCPSSKMHKEMDLKNIGLLKKVDQMKFIIKNKLDYNFAKKIITKFKPKCDIYFQPVWGENPKIIAEWIISDNLNVKLGLQLHKILWGLKRRV